MNQKTLFEKLEKWTKFNDICICNKCVTHDSLTDWVIQSSRESQWNARFLSRFTKLVSNPYCSVQNVKLTHIHLSKILDYPFSYCSLAVGCNIYQMRETVPRTQLLTSCSQKSPDLDISGIPLFRGETFWTSGIVTGFKNL